MTQDDLKRHYDIGFGALVNSGWNSRALSTLRVRGAEQVGASDPHYPDRHKRLLTVVMDHAKLDPKQRNELSGILKLAKHKDREERLQRFVDHHPSMKEAITKYHIGLKYESNLTFAEGATRDLSLVLNHITKIAPLDENTRYTHGQRKQFDLVLARIRPDVVAGKATFDVEDFDAFAKTMTQALDAGKPVLEAQRLGIKAFADALKPDEAEHEVPGSQIAQRTFVETFFAEKQLLQANGADIDRASMLASRNARAQTEDAVLEHRGAEDQLRSLGPKPVESAAVAVLGEALAKHVELGNLDTPARRAAFVKAHPSLQAAVHAYGVAHDRVVNHWEAKGKGPEGREESAYGQNHGLKAMSDVLKKTNPDAALYLTTYYEVKGKTLHDMLAAERALNKDRRGPDGSVQGALGRSDLEQLARKRGREAALDAVADRHAAAPVSTVSRLAGSPDPARTGGTLVAHLQEASPSVGGRALAGSGPAEQPVVYAPDVVPPLRPGPVAPSFG